MASQISLHSCSISQPSEFLSVDSLGEFCQSLINNMNAGVPTRMPRLHGWQLGFLLNAIKANAIN
ncbi:hypothetical protein GQG94_004796 [Salmonella enterica]|nr:hypothetical protein [Salmonella enterica]ELK3355832.1 hypothetical protein [Salmonella enterica]